MCYLHLDQLDMLSQNVLFGLLIDVRKFYLVKTEQSKQFLFNVGEVETCISGA